MNIEACATSDVLSMRITFVVMVKDKKLGKCGAEIVGAISGIPRMCNVLEFKQKTTQNWREASFSDEERVRSKMFALALKHLEAIKRDLHLR